MRPSVLAAMLALPFAALAQACDPRLAGGTQVESDRFILGFRSEPRTVSVGKHFILEVAVCPKAGAPVPAALAVDAHMPEHRHGMNYRAAVTGDPTGRYRATGLMFHMPGRWELVFDVRAGDKTDRLTRSIVAE